MAESRESNAQHLPALPIMGSHPAGGMQVERGILGAEIAFGLGSALEV